MPSCVATTRVPRGERRSRVVDTRDETCTRFLEDAAHYPGGRTRGVAFPETETDVAALLGSGVALLPVGAQSSLTGGATPDGEIVLSTARLNRVLEVRNDRVRVEAGVTLDALADALAPRGLRFPAAPTYTGATCGGIVATNAAGPTTFKYGVTRRWVRGLTVVLPAGDVLEIERGEITAHDLGYFDIEGATLRRVPVPMLRWPSVPKCSAGYRLEADMDLVDLFVGSEGTLGVVTEVALDLAPVPAATCIALVPMPSETAAIDLVDRLRRESRETWRAADPRGLDVAAIEHVDRRCLDLLRDDGAERRLRVEWPRDADVALFVEIELATPLSDQVAWREIEHALAPGGPDSALTRFCRLLEAAGALDETQLALPGETSRKARFHELREEVPAAVNRRVALARAGDARISKTAADVIVPFDEFGTMMAACRRGFADRGLDLAVWGHISDGNVHPNVIPRDFGDVDRGRDAVLDLGREVLRLGGCPLAEHGVGRNPIKKSLLGMLHGARGVAAMRQVKRALDPEGTLAPGVLL